MQPRCCRPVRPATSWVLYTTSCKAQSSAPEDGRDQHPKHVKLIANISKPLLLHLVGVYIIYMNDARSNKYQIYIMELSTTDGKNLTALSRSNSEPCKNFNKNLCDFRSSQMLRSVDY